jgi:hypothetical protein
MLYGESIFIPSSPVSHSLFNLSPLPATIIDAIPFFPHRLL